MINTLHGQVMPTDNATPHFLWSELACKCGCGSAYIAPRSLEKLEALRNMIGLPFHINSCARCPRHNSLVGGAPLSFHRSTPNSPTKAYDISLRTVDKADLIAAARRGEFKGIGVNYNSFVHCDDRTNRAEW